MWMTSALHDLTYFLTVTACTCSQRDFGSKENHLFVYFGKRKLQGGGQF